MTKDRVALTLLFKMAPPTGGANKSNFIGHN
jgi:hypothetical protein